MREQPGDHVRLRRDLKAEGNVLFEAGTLVVVVEPCTRHRVTVTDRDRYVTVRRGALDRATG